MSDNYQEEVKPLLKHLRTEAFRFIIVRYNHYDLVRRLEQELRNYFPERTLQKVNSSELTFQEISDKYYQQTNGFFWLENFDAVLRESDNNAEKSKITAGLNLRRDTFAKTPIALFVLVRADENLYGREIMLKMPDLWSFRSLMLDLEMEVQLGLENVHLFTTQQREKIEVLAKEQRQQKLIELENLQVQLAKTKENEVLLLEELYEQTADLQKELGKYEAALITLEQWKKVVGENILIPYKVGEIFMEMGNLNEAKSYFTKALDFFQNKEDKNNLAIIYGHLGYLESKLGNQQEALKLFKESNRLAKKIYEKFPNQIELKRILAISYERLGVTYSQLGNLEQALKLFKENNKLIKELFEISSHQESYKHSLAVSYSKLGDIYSQMGHIQNALKFFEEYNQLSKELYEEYPNKISYKNSLAVSYSRLGATYIQLGDFQNALKFFEGNNKLSKEICDEHPSQNFRNNLAASYSRLGDVHTKLGNLQEALKFFEEDNRLSKKLYEKYPNQVSCKYSLAISYLKLGDTHTQLGNFQNALKFFEENKRLTTELFEEFPQQVSFKNSLAVSYQRLGWFLEQKKGDKQKILDNYLASKKLFVELVQASPRLVESQSHLNWVEGKLSELE